MLLTLSKALLGVAPRTVANCDVIPGLASAQLHMQLRLNHASWAALLVLICLWGCPATETHLVTFQNLQGLHAPVREL